MVAQHRCFGLFAWEICGLSTGIKSACIRRWYVRFSPEKESAWAMLALVLGLIAQQEAGRKGGWASCAIREGVPRFGNSPRLGIFFPLFFVEFYLRCLY